MAWRLEDSSGPHRAPWEGRDATGWIWEIYSDAGSRRVIVEVSGTAMAIADEYLPNITAQARATFGRSEVEKILDLDDPPRRIALGTTGYLGSQPVRPDLLVSGADGRPIAVVEVKNPQVLTAAEACTIRDRFAEAIGARFYLIVSQARGFLFDQERAYRPVAELEMFDVIRTYYPPATEHQRFKGRELELIIQQWVGDLINGEPSFDLAAHRVLAENGFTEAVREANLRVSPAV